VKYHHHHRRDEAQKIYTVNDASASKAHLNPDMMERVKGTIIIISANHYRFFRPEITQP